MRKGEIGLFYHRGIEYGSFSSRIAIISGDWDSACPRANKQGWIERGLHCQRKILHRSCDSLPVIDEVYDGTNYDDRFLGTGSLLSSACLQFL